MFIHAFVASVRTGPKPAVLAVLDGLYKVLADLVCRRLGVTVFAEHHLPKFLLVPFLHLILLFLFLLLLPRIVVQVDLLGFPSHFQIVAEFAFLPLLAYSFLVELAHHRLRINPKWHFLCLCGLEQFCGFSLCCLSCGFLLSFLFFERFFPLVLCRFIGLGLRFELFNLVLSLATFLVLHAKGLVIDGHLLFRRLILCFGRHAGRLVRRLLRMFRVVFGRCTFRDLGVAVEIERLKAPLEEWTGWRR